MMGNAGLRWPIAQRRQTETGELKLGLELSRRASRFVLSILVSWRGRLR